MTASMAAQRLKIIACFDRIAADAMHLGEGLRPVTPP
jgi:hypothetical protein